MTMTWQRSEAETFEGCKRRGYWGYLHNGRGIERKALSVPLLTGGAVHEPLAAMLKYACVRPHATKVEFNEMAGLVIAEARGRYLSQVRERGLLLDYFDGSDAQLGQVVGRLGDEAAWQVNEQLALLEALVKGWVRVRLPRLIEEYAVVDVETEENFRLGPDITFMTRRDALLRRWKTGEHYVLSFKTVSDPNQTWRESFRYDVQTISEFVAAEQSLDGPGLVRGVLVEALVKGQRKLEWPDDSGQWRHNSPLLYHWATSDQPPMPRFYKASAYYTCPDSHPWRWVKGGVCPGGKKHRIGDEYQRDMVCQTLGIDAWLDWLGENEPQLLEAQFLALPAILRSQYDIERWKRQAQSEALDIRERHQAAADHNFSDGSLDVFFPMSTGHQNCLRPSRCPFIDLCFGISDPDDAEMYVPRQYNHPQEAELVGHDEAVTVGTGCASSPATKSRV